MAQSRQPTFYTEFEVADSIEGRLELLVGDARGMDEGVDDGEQPPADGQLRRAVGRQGAPQVGDLVHQPQRRVALFVDEWGMWHDPEPGTNGAFLQQQNTLCDALVAALTLELVLVRLFGLDLRRRLPVLTGIALLTPLPWYASYLMPDLFAGLLVLAASLLVNQEIQDLICDTGFKRELLPVGGGTARIFAPDGRMIAEPLGLFDCCGVADGSAAAIVTTPEIARALGKKDLVTVKALQLAISSGVESTTTAWDGSYANTTRTAAKREVSTSGSIGRRLNHASCSSTSSTRPRTTAKPLCASRSSESTGERFHTPRLAERAARSAAC